jgi:SAM-dependent methyltransferase
MSDIVEQVKERYGKAAQRATEKRTAGEAEACGCDCETLGCCGDDASAVTAGGLAKSIGYSDADLAQAGEGNLGLGCGNPLALARIRPGMTVLDLGSGAGFDAFLAAERVGAAGRVIGVDMTPEMLALARKNAETRGATNVEFREGRIEALPLEDASVDLVISNCVINLSPDKPRVFREVLRVLKPGGTLSVSDLVLAGPLPDSVRKSVEAYVGCVAGASPVGDYVAELFAAGFHEVSVPRITSAAAMVEGLGSGAEGGGCCGQVSQQIPAGDLAAAGRAIVSATFFAQKPL